MHLQKRIIKRNIKGTPAKNERQRYIKRYIGTERYIHIKNRVSSLIQQAD